MNDFVLTKQKNKSKKRNMSCVIILSEVKNKLLKMVGNKHWIEWILKSKKKFSSSREKEKKDNKC